MVMPSRNVRLRLNQQPSALKLRLLSYNIHNGVATNGYHHYFTRSWELMLPHPKVRRNLSSIATLLRDFDIAGLQELDRGSLRSGFVNQAQYLRERAGFPLAYCSVNRRMGVLAQHAMAILSRLVFTRVTQHRLPGRVPGRTALVAHLWDGADPLHIVLVHLALGSSSRLQQIDYLIRLIREYTHVIVMGDMNCGERSKEMQLLRKKTDLHLASEGLPTYPSWRPKRHYDHILVSPNIRVDQVRVLRCPFSDHLPLAVEVLLPRSLHLSRLSHSLPVE